MTSSHHLILPPRARLITCAVTVHTIKISTSRQSASTTVYTSPIAFSIFSFIAYTLFKIIKPAYYFPNVVLMASNSVAYFAEYSS